MVKRATIHVSSSTKKKSSENGEIRGIKRKQQIQPIQYFTTKLPLQGKQVAILSSRSCCFWLFTLQKDCIHAQRVLSSRSVVHRCKSCFSCFPYSAGSIEEFRPRSVVTRCKSCFSCFPYSAGCIETTRYNVCIPPFEDKKLYSYE